MSEIDEIIDYTLIDEMNRLLQKHQWITSYELFYQVIEKIDINYQNRKSEKGKFTLKKNRKTGIALRALSPKKKLFELSLGISSLHRLADLKEPKSTQKSEDQLKFLTLKPPRMSSVPGDNSKSINFREETAAEKIEELRFELEKFDVTEQNINLNLERESRYLTNTGSKGISSISLKTHVNHDIKFQYDGFIQGISRERYRRNLNFDKKQIRREFETILEHRTKKLVSANLDNVSVIFHPQIIGKIIAFRSKPLISHSPRIIKNMWKDNIYLYDDPLRDEGYASILFDDEGNLTKSTKLIEKGDFVNSLHTISSSPTGKGGNGYRIAWFQPLSRSYEFPVTRSISNLVMTGGVGKGENFIEKNTLSILVRGGHGYIGGMANNPKFVIHANETELWKNGECLGPTYNYTFSGSLNEIMKLGDLSKDQTQVVDRAIPGAVYIGWLRCAAGIVKID
ncbi:MAG: hypothetical protein GPJ54_13600 [Candidatus Heimdallarchaeota archaeon]|nr:hypothetical protein [Candidatus Heimdallarchaeota archaeon]